MKIKFLQIKKSFKKGGHNANPDFFWQLLLVIACVLVVVSFCFAFILFKQINSDTTGAGATTDQKHKSISKERIDAILQIFSDKEKKSIDILTSPSPVVDPSL